jgi:hypothetical protein
MNINLDTDSMDYEELRKAIDQIIREVPLTWVPALTIQAMKSAKARRAFSADGLSTIAKRVEETDA